MVHGLHGRNGQCVPLHVAEEPQPGLEPVPTQHQFGVGIHVQRLIQPRRQKIAMFSHVRVSFWSYRLKQKRKEKQKQKQKQKFSAKAMKKRNPVLRADRPAKQGRSVGRFTKKKLFFYLWFQKITPKTQKILRKLWYSVQKNFGKIFRLIFKKFQPKLSDLGQKTADFTRFWKKFKKNNFLPKRKFGSVAPIKQGFLFLWP